MTTALETDSETVLRLMGFLIRSVKKESARELSALGLNQMDVVVLKMVSEGPVAPVAVAYELGVSRAAVTYVTRKLEKANLIKREAAERDRRMALFRLTREGAAALEGAQRVYYACLMRKLGRISEGDVRVLRSLLEKIVGT